MGAGAGEVKGRGEVERQRDRGQRTWTLFNLVSLSGSAPTPVLCADALPCPRAQIWQRRGPVQLHEQATGVLFDAPVPSECKAKQLFTTAHLPNLSTTSSTTSVVLNFKYHFTFLLSPPALRYAALTEETRAT
jgi:hypothetical protein